MFHVKPHFFILHVFLRNSLRFWQIDRIYCNVSRETLFLGKKTNKKDKFLLHLVKGCDIIINVYYIANFVRNNE